MVLLERKQLQTYHKNTSYKHNVKCNGHKLNQWRIRFARRKNFFMMRKAINQWSSLSRDTVGIFKTWLHKVLRNLICPVVDSALPGWPRILMRSHQILKCLLIVELLLQECKQFLNLWSLLQNTTLSMKFLTKQVNSSKIQTKHSAPVSSLCV